MPKPVAKKKKTTALELEKHVIELADAANEREEYVQKILYANDGSIDMIVEKMVELLRGMSQPPQITLKGQAFRSVNGEVKPLTDIQTKNYRYLAVHILVACAEWGIRVGDFKLPKARCSRCGKKVKSGK
jgi:hypothetical protein